jgi:GntR family transcriptional regulator, histidine utilization repressor
VSSSLHQSILADIEDRILRGEWPPGYRIPFEHELTAQYGCSRMTVNKVLTQLARAGFIERRRKAGSFVLQPHSQSAVLEIQDIKAEVAALGQPYRYEITARRQRRRLPANQRLLEPSPAGPVLDLTCRHFAGPRPFCLEERLINLAAVPEAAAETFAEVAPGPWLLNRVPWTAAEHRIRASTAGPAGARALQIAEGAACLVIERRTWRADHPITFVRMTYPADAHELVARFAPIQA